jgi:hypothetical protein
MAQISCAHVWMEAQPFPSAYVDPASWGREAKLLTAQVGCVIPCPHIPQVPIGGGHLHVCGDGGCDVRCVPHSDPGDGSILEPTKKAQQLPIKEKWVTAASSPRTPKASALACVEANAGDGAANRRPKHTDDPLCTGVGDSDPPIWPGGEFIIGAMHLLSAPLKGNLQGT